MYRKVCFSIHIETPSFPSRKPGVLLPLPRTFPFMLRITAYREGRCLRWGVFYARTRRLAATTIPPRPNESSRPRLTVVDASGTAAGDVGPNARPSGNLISLLTLNFVPTPALLNSSIVLSPELATYSDCWAWTAGAAARPKAARAARVLMCRN